MAGLSLFVNLLPVAWCNQQGVYTMLTVAEYQDIDPSAPFYVRNASAVAIAPYVGGLAVAVVRTPPPIQERVITVKGNGALPVGAYDMASYSVAC